MLTENPENVAYQSIPDLVKVDVMKLMTRNLALEPVQVNYGEIDKLAGTNYNNLGLKKVYLGSWIVDTGATCHMCADVNLLSSLILHTIW